MSETEPTLAPWAAQLEAIQARLDEAAGDHLAMREDLLALRADLSTPREAPDPDPALPDGLVELLDRRLAEAAQAVVDLERQVREAWEVRLEAVLRAVIEVGDRLDQLAGSAATEQDAAELRRRLESCAGPRDRLRQVVADWGVVGVPGEGAPYDPKLHEAVRHERLPEVGEAVVLQVLSPGYRRPEADHAFCRARVVVALPAAGAAHPPGGAAHPTGQAMHPAEGAAQPPGGALAGGAALPAGGAAHPAGGAADG